MFAPQTCIVQGQTIVPDPRIERSTETLIYTLSNYICKGINIQDQ